MTTAMQSKVLFLAVTGSQWLPQENKGTRQSIIGTRISDAALSSW